MTSFEEQLEALQRAGSDATSVDRPAAAAALAAPGEGPPTPEQAAEELAAFSPNENAARSRARQIAKLVAETGAEQAVLGDWRDLLKGHGHLSVGEFDAIVKQVTDRRKKEQEAREAAERAAGHAARLDAAIAQGVIMPSPANPLAVARALMDKEPRTAGHPHRAWWRDDFYRWDSTRWVVEPVSSVRKWIYRATEHAEYDAGEVRGIVAWQPDRDKVNKVVDALGTALIQRAAEDEAEHVIACTNGVYDLATRELLPHNPRRFNLISLPYAYDPDATCPLWLQFLDQVLPNIEGVPPEQQGQQFLREWFGYSLSGRTDLQKLASLVGPPRCGKGTVARVLKALLGEANVVAPTLRNMAGQFGEESFIGKTLAILGDVRWHTQAAAEAIDIFLAITGEDAHDVHRKNRVAWHGTLGLRFLVMSNDPPKFSDASGALAIRMIQLVFEQSFVGREDPDLTDKLLAELPGIFNWAIDGLRTLNARGRFVEPACGTEVSEQVRRAASPEYAFVEDMCTLGEDDRVLLDTLYLEFTRWSTREGRQHVTPKETFGANLRSAHHGKVRVIRPGKRGEPRPYYVQGLRLGQEEGDDAEADRPDTGHQPALIDEVPTCGTCGFEYDTQSHAINCLGERP
ncbi:hypothetical protein Drose_06380 [Dactylosporangium roseum]|uniref:SF3 helicase domain-containing protein n=1 Tax=Dactylosporangium roseum TaxID=47989 RepID=A0ABY5Z768_9ACTN|nr:phage/plasmid primase, P4 family [Dactylosporangium roseum]UWZ37899.1 hypothetical protein Drose_06380 [Dactylosporangium roseum]